MVMGSGFLFCFSTDSHTGPLPPFCECLVIGVMWALWREKSTLLSVDLISEFVINDDDQTFEPFGKNWNLGINLNQLKLAFLD